MKSSVGTEIGKFVGRNKAKRFLLDCITPHCSLHAYGAMRLDKASDLLRPTDCCMASAYVD
ncbi:MAG: hypothetical protein K2Q15_09790, partial [Burkholderiales bacterium]|nr:hypothetical protein [Burkholderiales bacterium]